ncbi:hypothetical protein AB0L05_10360 [Nonomuraea pusilla]|uniref:hypothetical protein n=1 Tax=Nonomuraea pusilla TaxID=46177 RepID=UPI00331AC4DE
MILAPLAPAVVVPQAANVLTWAAVAALVAVPVVVLRRRRRVPRLGAALLALLAVGAAVPPFTGLGRPSEEEMRQRLEVAIATGGPADAADAIRGDALSVLPWRDDELLLFALALLAAAGLSAALGRALHGERREVLPLRWRWPLTMWGAALALVSVPYAMLVTGVAAGTAEYEVMVMGSGCGGAVDEILFGSATAAVILIPQPIVVAVGFGLWALLARAGHRSLGRVVGRVTVVPLVVGDVVVSWMPVIGTVMGCARSSDEAVNPITLPWALFVLLPVVLVLVAVRMPRRARYVPAGALS